MGFMIISQTVQEKVRKKFGDITNKFVSRRASNLDWFA